MSTVFNDLLLITFILVTIPCFTYWMGYRNGEKSGELKTYRDQDKQRQEPSVE